MQMLNDGETTFYPQIEVDDAGWGDLVGGVIIGGYNPLTEEFRWTEVAVEHFQGEAFTRKDYQVKARRAMNRILGDLRVDKRFYQVAMCTGYVLNHVARWLRQNGWMVVRRTIDGPCQGLVEERFRKELMKIGVPPGTIVNVPSGTHRFMQLFKWVKEDPEERESFVKTGWSSWQSKWRPRLFEK